MGDVWWLSTTARCIWSSDLSRIYWVFFRPQLCPFIKSSLETLRWQKIWVMWGWKGRLGDQEEGEEFGARLFVGRAGSLMSIHPNVRSFASFFLCYLLCPESGSSATLQFSCFSKPFPSSHPCLPWGRGESLAGPEGRKSVSSSWLVFDVQRKWTRMTEAPWKVLCLGLCLAPTWHHLTDAYH